MEYEENKAAKGQKMTAATLNVLQLLLKKRLIHDIAAYKKIIAAQEKDILPNWLSTRRIQQVCYAYNYEPMKEELFSSYEPFKYLYDLGEASELDITDKILESSEEATPSSIKELIKATGRRFILFSFFSQGQPLKGVISLPKTVNEDLETVILFRGGGATLGLPHPAHRAAFWFGERIFVLTPEREWEDNSGKSDFGGPRDIQDYINLIQNLPRLFEKVGATVSYNPLQSLILLGESNGGNRILKLLETVSDTFQQKIKKVITLSGALDYLCMFDSRPDCYSFWEHQYGLACQKDVKQSYPEWVLKLNVLKEPLLKKISSHIHFLIIQVLDDDRVLIKQGLHFDEMALNTDLLVNNWLVQSGGHCAARNQDFGPEIAQWLEDPAYLPEAYAVQRFADLPYEALVWMFAGSPGSKMKAST